MAKKKVCDNCKRDEKAKYYSINGEIEFLCKSCVWQIANFTNSTIRDIFCCRIDDTGKSCTNIPEFWVLEENAGPEMFYHSCPTHLPNLLLGKGPWLVELIQQEKEEGDEQKV